ncbi:VOC family protein [Streptomyces sp. NBC_01171]|uniref:VOC family protein n=1 Tax=Streptomyces sp. NBC_01171 TaxID=2903757 RepID=UPI003863163B
MDMKFEVAVVPVSDVDRAKAFYTALGWRLDADVATDGGFRVVQVTPPGSPASVIFGSSLTEQSPGSARGLHLAVDDIEAAREELVRGGADPSEVFHDAGGVFHHAGTDARVPGPAPDNGSYGSFVSFSDPDGNGWFLQEIHTASGTTGPRGHGVRLGRRSPGRAPAGRGGARRARGPCRHGGR